ncbi:hypothetical protein Glove_306g55 [Diversispora epigaea]|uniref:Uncharacterized protein n=1 Tax=Diversispora epigaea TaxID=1348612 RepID=A0A397HTT9_9GLOM|nr:hypothetical protein Glove_306g55 [Diversispora epigaea]
MGKDSELRYLIIEGFYEEVEMDLPHKLFGIFVMVARSRDHALEFYDLKGGNSGVYMETNDSFIFSLKNGNIQN